jgi:amino acid adenylation domain-containing protein
MSDFSSGVTNTSPEQQAIRAKCFHPTGRFVEFTKDEIAQSIPSRFEQIAAKYPDRIVVRGKTVTLTYYALNSLANRVAHAILNRCGKRVEPIALLFERDAPAIAAILGVLKAGKIYVPLDPAYPHARSSAMVENSQAALVVTDTRHRALAETIIGDSHRLLNVDELDSNLSEDNVGLHLPPETLYGIFYTSGSTGEPKGVVENHGNVLYHVMAYTNEVHVCADDRLTLLHSLSFRAAEIHLFGALLNGAALFPLDLNKMGIANLAGWLNDECITIYHSIPMVFRHFVQTLPENATIPTLRLIHLSGSTAGRRELELYKRAFGSQCLLLNRMGFTEGYTIRWCFIDHSTEIDSSKLPVGYAVAETEVILLDEAGNQVGPGDIGEITVKSSYLVPRYWRRPDLTRAAFLPDPDNANRRIYRTGDLGRMRSDGCLQHLGRKDFQVKIRGYRIDITEIECALLGHAAIEDASVTTHEDRSGDTVLVAYIILARMHELNATELRRFLRVVLPDYMIPSVFVKLESLPLTPNGKLDYRALPALEHLRPELETAYVAPKTVNELRIATVWQEVLGLERVGSHDNFFDLGGNSLLLAEVHSNLQEIFQKEIPMVHMFEHPTINALARYLNQRNSDATSSQGSHAPVVDPGKNRLRALAQRRQSTGKTSDRGDKQRGK